MKYSCFTFFLTLCLLCGKWSISQYILNGSAKQDNCNCYTLTTETNTQSGSVWNSNKISLTRPFDFWFNVFLGCKDVGADGIVFILQPLSTSVGTTGEGMGFGGVSPSIGIALDTYQNPTQNDPYYDHISIQANGNVNQNNDLAGPVPISSTSDNVEDCQWHKLRITWDPSTQWLRAYFDGVLRVEKQVDLIGTIFGNDPNVYWGFTGATGGQNNIQKFCTALNPIIATNLSIDTACIGTSIQFTSQSESFAPIIKYNWSFGDGSQSAAMDPPSHAYTSSGAYPVKLKITGMDGCENDTTKTIVIAPLPSADLNVSDTCYSIVPRMNFHSSSFGISRQWVIDNNFPGLNQQPSLTALPAGNHNLKLIVSSLYSCGIPDTASSDFTIKPVPQIQLQASDGCINKAVRFDGEQLDNATSIHQWNWDFGDHLASEFQNTQHTYKQASKYTIRLWANADNGCSSDTVKKTIIINDAYAFAGNDTIIIRNRPFQLHGISNGSRFDWSPSFGLNNPNIADPVATLSDKQDYVFTITTSEGCLAKDTIHIRAIEGPAIYVASAFTPNGDGLNDILHPAYVGITRLKKFAVYDRWGKLVFSTSDMKKGWDGTADGKLSATGTYVWIAQAENYLQQPINLKGTVTVIR